MLVDSQFFEQFTSNVVKNLPSSIAGTIHRERERERERHKRTRPKFAPVSDYLPWARILNFLNFLNLDSMVAGWPPLAIPPEGFRVKKYLVLSVCLLFFSSSVLLCFVCPCKKSIQMQLKDLK